MSFDFLLLIFYFSKNWYAAQVSDTTMLIFFQLLVQLSALSFASADSSFLGMTIASLEWQPLKKVKIQKSKTKSRHSLLTLNS